MNRILLSLSAFFAMLVVSAAATPVYAQVVQPVIAEYTRSGDGFFQVTNEGTSPQIVTLEPKSFSLNADGTGVFRPLDSTIHLELSATSLRLEPQQTARVFYKVNADALPAWLCVYASFSPLKEAQGVNLRIMLPHTIYVYQREQLQKEDIAVTDVRYDNAAHKVVAELTNHGTSAGRAAEVEITGSHTSSLSGGFPMLPGEKRTLTLDWTGDKKPEQLNLRFAKFQLKLPIPAVAE